MEAFRESSKPLPALMYFDQAGADSSSIFSARLK